MRRGGHCLAVDWQSHVDYLRSHYPDNGTMGAGLCGFCCIQVEQRFFDAKTLSGICELCRDYVRSRREEAP
jgi:hypothetical protein